jgi:8-oxo-dGTP diphosphatase
MGRTIETAMTEYVAGFFFDTDREHVVLIEKQKPEWQKGLLNAVGGKIEPGETALDAMRREFLEETGYQVSLTGENDWTHYVTLTGEGFAVHFFYAVEWRHPRRCLCTLVKTMETEKVATYRIAELTKLKTINNLQWLIPMALTMKGESAVSFVVTEMKDQSVCV